jgi:hypothetical protein
MSDIAKVKAYKLLWEFHSDELEKEVLRLSELGYSICGPGSVGDHANRAIFIQTMVKAQDETI